MTTATIPARATALLSNRDSLTLIADFQALDGVYTDEAPTVRGWIMDALDGRGDLGLLAIAEGACPLCWTPDTAGCDC